MFHLSERDYFCDCTKLFVMKPTHIEHIGIAVKNIENAIELYEKLLGLKCYKVEEVADQKVRTAFFLIGQTKIELLESTDSEGLLENLL